MQDLELKVYMIIFGSFQITKESLPIPEVAKQEGDMMLKTQTKDLADHDTASVDNVK